MFQRLSKKDKVRVCEIEDGVKNKWNWSWPDAKKKASVILDFGKDRCLHVWASTGAGFVNSLSLCESRCDDSRAGQDQAAFLFTLPCRGGGWIGEVVMCVHILRCWLGDLYRRPKKRYFVSGNIVDKNIKAQRAKLEALATKRKAEKAHKDGPPCKRKHWMCIKYWTFILKLRKKTSK